MKQAFKKTVCVLLTLAMLLGVCVIAVPAVTAQAVGVGDTIQFGTYPQTKVTDDDLIAALNDAEKTWMSYGYYSGNGAYNGQQQPGDWMRYADFFYGGEKYRAVTFERYRPRWLYWAAETTGDSYNDIYGNGYRSNRVYYFKYEPLVWKVLDPDTGLILCQSVIDSQNYCSVVYQAESGAYFNGVDSNVYASNYFASNVRAWMNYDFYNAAFTDAQRAKIKTTRVDNSANDKILCLSRSEAYNRSYGLGSGNVTGYATDYAKAQGVQVSSSDGSSPWKLRTPNGSRGVYFVAIGGSIFDSEVVYQGSWIGDRPACCLSVLANDTEVTEYLPSEHMSEGHTLTGPLWSWAADCSSATMRFACTGCTYEEAVTDHAPAVTVLSAQTCTTPKTVTATATVVYKGGTYTDTVENVTVAEATGHSYGEPVWTWADDHSYATAAFTCAQNDDTQEVTDNAPGVTEVSAPTCTADRVVRYTARVTFNDFEYSTITDPVTAAGSANGHDWGEPVWTWADNNDSATAAFTCGVCEEELTLEADVAYADGLYTATVELDGEIYTDSKQKVVTLTLDMGGYAENMTLEVKVGADLGIVLMLNHCFIVSDDGTRRVMGFLPKPAAEYESSDALIADRTAVLSMAMPDRDLTLCAHWNEYVVPEITVAAPKCGAPLGDGSDLMTMKEPDKYYIKGSEWIDTEDAVFEGGKDYVLYAVIRTPVGYTLQSVDPVIVGAELLDGEGWGNYAMHLGVAAVHYADETSEIKETVLTPATATAAGEKQVCVYCAGGCGEIVETYTETIPAAGEPETPADPAAGEDGACHLCGEYHDPGTVCGFFTGMLHDLIYIIKRLASFFCCEIIVR